MPSSNMFFSIIPQVVYPLGGLRIFALLLLQGLFLLSMAQTPEDPGIDTSRLDPVVITGQVGGVRATRTMVKYRVITAQTIEQMASVNLADLLSRQANIRLGNDNMLGSSVSLQNLSGQQIKFLVNGMPVTGREAGNINLDQINLEEVERIEIIEGPMSVIYGTDALGGVINVITKTPVLQQSQASLYTYNETIGNYNMGASVRVPIQTHKLVTAGLSRNFFSGLEGENGSRSQLWKPREQIFGHVGAYWDAGKSTWNYRSDLLVETLQSKGNAVINPVEAYAFDDYFETLRGIHSLNTRFDIGSHIGVDMINGMSHYKRSKKVYRKDLVELEQVQIENEEENTNNLFTNYMMRAVLSNKQRGRINYLVGYDLNLDYASADRVDGDDLYMGDFAVFAMLDYYLTPEIRVRPGARIAYNSLFDSPVTPSLHFMWSPSNKLQIRSSYGRGFRAPSLKEQRLLFVDINHNVRGNPNLNPEYSHNVQLGVDFKNYHQKQKIAYSFGVNSYYNHVVDMVGLVLVDEVEALYSYENYGKFSGGGFLIEQKTTYKQLDLDAAVGYMFVQNQFSAEVGDDFYFTPDVTLSVSYRLGSKGPRLGLFMKHNGRFVNYIQNEQGNVSQFFTDAMTFLDFTASHKFYNEKLSVTVGAKNILNVQNIANINPFNSFHSGNGLMSLSPGRSLFVRVGYQL